ncbi:MULTISPECIES: esterase FrsA [unclassified Vibrio]|uniref:esterase FrsA n=1 Tax=unclassified Vibrio TaxID=2614977 RepID=UPI001482BCC5|nr:MULTISPECIES: esterase FrsA [unclassified Vibrio]NNN43117.1 esterase FrsA [Vibrio sp. 1-1(7)]NNN73969.1 esterase FrsA [Vibrio sp. 12-2(3-a)]
MSDSSSNNLSETLFQKHKQAKETSTLTQYMPSSLEFIEQKMEQDTFFWYRNLRRLQWAWLGIDPIDQEEVLARIASSQHSRTYDKWLDTVIGYHSGNWTYEWTRLGANYHKQSESLTGDQAAERMFSASLCYSIAGYPHLKKDNLAIQARVLANQAYQQAAELTKYTIKPLEFDYQGKKIIGHLHLSHTNEPQPVVMVSAGLDSLQTDMWRLFRDYLAKRNIAMLTIDMPSVGHSHHWPLTQDSSCLHQAVLNQLAPLPWVDHRRVGLVGFRFGGNAMVRLSFLESSKIKACVSIGAPVHDIFVSQEKMKMMSKMYLDVLASRLGKNTVDIPSLSAQLMAWSLKVQGVLATRRTPVPILALSMEGDPVSPASDNHLIATFSQGGKAKLVKDESISRGYEQSLDLAIKWLEEQLCG